MNRRRRCSSAARAATARGRRRRRRGGSRQSSSPNCSPPRAERPPGTHFATDKRTRGERFHQRPRGVRVRRAGVPRRRRGARARPRGSRRRGNSDIATQNGHRVAALAPLGGVGQPRGSGPPPHERLFRADPVRDGRTERRYAVEAMPGWPRPRKAGGTACSSTPRRSTALNRGQLPVEDGDDAGFRARRASRGAFPPLASPRGPFAFANTKLSSLKSPCTMRPLGSLGGTCARNHSISSVMNGSGVTTASAVLPRPPLHLPPRVRVGLAETLQARLLRPRAAARPGCRPWRRTRRRGARRRAGSPAPAAGRCLARTTIR